MTFMFDRKILRVVIVTAIVFSLARLVSSSKNSDGDGLPLSPAAGDSHASGDTQLVDSMLTAGTFALIEPASVTFVPATSDEEGRTLATVAVEELVWQAPVGDAEWQPLQIGVPRVEILDQEGIWAESSGLLATGGRVVFGMGSGSELGEYSLSFALHIAPSGVNFLGTNDPFWDQQLGAFANFSGNPIHQSCGGTTTDCLLALITEWNAEVHAIPPPNAYLQGPIQVAFSQFWDPIDNRPEISWRQTPPEFRSIADAPELVRSALPYAEVWVYVPDSWDVYQDGAICLRISEGSNGCMHVNSSGEGHLVPMDGWRIPGEAIRVEARPLDDSWDAEVADYSGGIEIGQIAPEIAKLTGIVLLELDPTGAPASYDALRAAGQPATPLVTSRAISIADLQDLLAREPQGVLTECGTEC